MDVSPRPPIGFGPPGPIGSADIVIDDGTVYQPVLGFGASLSECIFFFLELH
jgi:hypothetical protein